MVCCDLWMHECRTLSPACLHPQRASPPSIGIGRMHVSRCQFCIPNLFFFSRGRRWVGIWGATILAAAARFVARHRSIYARGLTITNLIPKIDSIGLGIGKNIESPQRS